MEVLYSLKVYYILHYVYIICMNEVLVACWIIRQKYKIMVNTVISDIHIYSLPSA